MPFQGFWFFSIIILLVGSRVVRADCTSIPAYSLLPVGKQGQISLSVEPNKLMYCDGTTWQDLGGSVTATACTKNGETVLVGGELHYCNQSVLWRFDSGTSTNGSCTKAGELRWNSGTSRLEFCNGSDWRVVGTDGNADTITPSVATNWSWSSINNNFSRVTGITQTTATLNRTGSCPQYIFRSCAAPGGTGCDNAKLLVEKLSFADGETVTLNNGDYLLLRMDTRDVASDTCTASLTVGTMVWTESVTTSATDLIPNSFSFAIDRLETAGSWAESRIELINGHSGVTGTISDLGTGGTPEFRVCSDSLCASAISGWSTASQTIPTGHYVQVRTTMASLNPPTVNQSGRQVQLSAGTTTGLWYAHTGSCRVAETLAAGASITCSCGNNQVGRTGTVIGSANRYRQSSDPCLAAIHAGAITNASGGDITIRGVGASGANCSSGFTGSTANGITTTSSGAGTGFFFPSLGSDPCSM